MILQIPISSNFIQEEGCKVKKLTVPFQQDYFVVRKEKLRHQQYIKDTFSESALVKKGGTYNIKKKLKSW